MGKWRALFRNKSVKKKSLFVAFTIFIEWYTLLKRESRGAERVFIPELFWAIRGWIINLTVVNKVEAGGSILIEYPVLHTIRTLAPMER